MKFSTSLEDRNYLQKTGSIPFLQLLNEAELKELNTGIAKAAKDLPSGRDLWRLNEFVKKIVFSKRLVNLVYELTQKKPIRLAFDQYLPEKGKGLLDSEKKALIFNYFNAEVPVQDRSSINSLVAFILIVLSSDENSEIPAGGGYFILPATQFSPESLSQTQRYLLIGYGDKHSQYLYETRDPQVHHLKTLGYVFGDKLNDEIHPILLR